MKEAYNLEFYDNMRQSKNYETADLVRELFKKLGYSILTHQGKSYLIKEFFPKPTQTSSYSIESK